MNKPNYKGLMRDIIGPTTGGLTGIFDPDTLTPWLSEASTTMMLNVRIPRGSGPTLRWGIRALSAVVQNESVDVIARRIQYTLNNPHLTLAEIYGVLMGNKDEASVTLLQAIGSQLREGVSHARIARELACSRLLVSKLDQFLGVSIARQDKLVGDTLIVMAEGANTWQEVQAKVRFTSDQEARRVHALASQVQEELG